VGARTYIYVYTTGNTHEFVLTTALWFRAAHGGRLRWRDCEYGVQTYLLDIQRMPTKKSVLTHRPVRIVPAFPTVL
jgi:hypothetical protein